MPSDPPLNPPNPSRREFLQQTGGTAAATFSACASAHLSSAVAQSALPESGDERMSIEGAVPITLRINGQDRKLRIDPRTTLLDCIRETVTLTGTKKGCDHGQCGACTVHVDGRRVNSCLSLALLHDGADITTIEGLGAPDAMHPMQEAFVAFDAYQCGYCTSGQIMSAAALLNEPCGADDASVKELMSGNICRCGAYCNIVAAIQQVRKNA
ncbi:oxidoreductase [cyanobacterium TDX16]|nr:oxidoreductase [cyanobacterium TDX16]